MAAETSTVEYRIGLESGDENRSIAWVLGHPGCFSYGTGKNTAIAAVPKAVKDYSNWIKSHGETWLKNGEVKFKVVEEWDVYFVNQYYEKVDEGYAVNAWFLDDWKPLSQYEIDRGLKLLEWTRQDLLVTVHDLTQERLNLTYPGERWSILGLLNHVASAEWWYLDRLGLGFPRYLLHDDVFERLKKVRSHLVELLPSQVGRHFVAGIEAEFWSPRKLLRRAVWHERDHTFHIRKLIAQ
jgi:hypothetical protein